MVVVLADKRDEVTLRVLEVLSFLGVDFFHIHEDDRICIDRIDAANAEFNISVNSEARFNLAKCVIWNRHSYILKQGIRNTLCWENITPQLKNFLINETDVLADYVIRSLQPYKLFGWQTSSRLNKLQVINLAQSLGFNVPQTVVVGNAKTIDRNIQYITKSISEIYQIVDERTISTNFAYQIDTSGLDQHEQFFPSLLQQKINRAGDVRLFVFRNLFYASLIVSENGEIDYRQNYDLPSTRFLPYEIDELTRTKVLRLLEKLELDSGSLDFLLDSNGKLWFLEVNPEGQFGFMEYHCGYDIATQLALKISEYV